MKCIECYACHKKKIIKHSANTVHIETKYMCHGVKEPFEIKDVNQECTEYPKLINSEVENKVTTNGDYIRSMSDKRLAQFLSSEWFITDVCSNCEGEYDRCGDFKFCEFKILEWLKKERI